jgi:hypothetical protein
MGNTQSNSHSLGYVCKLNQGEAFVDKIKVGVIYPGTNADAGSDANATLSPLQSNFGLCRHALVLKTWAYLYQAFSDNHVISYLVRKFCWANNFIFPKLILNFI